MPAPLARIPVGVVVERRRAKSAWVDVVWTPVAVLHGEPVAAPWTVLSGDAEQSIFYAGTTEIELYRSETGHYRDNLLSDTPSLWVALRPVNAEPPLAIAAVTADPAEGEGLTEPGDAIVEAVAMPDAIRDLVAAFVNEHHVEKPFEKRKRDRADPEALARRAPPDREERKAMTEEGTRSGERRGEQ